MERGINRHHFNWCAREWRRDSLARRIREHPGMILPMRITVHDSLHKEIQPIRPPYQPLARLVLSNLLSVENNNDPLINLANQSHFLLNLAEEDSRIGDEAFRLGSHYLDQLMFINENR